MEVDGVVVAWDPASRSLWASYPAGCRPTGAGARRLHATVADWVGEREPFRLVAAGEGMGNVSLAWRLEWLGFFRRNAARMSVGIVGPPLDALAVVRLFAWDSGVRFRDFHDEREARAWADDALGVRTRASR